MRSVHGVLAVEGGRATRTIALLSLGGRETAADDAHHGWELGEHTNVASSVEAGRSALRTASGAHDAVLVLDATFPIPERTLLDRLLDGPADAWHAGLHLGNEGRPRLLDHVHPVWMLNAALDPTIEATSWRISLRALLVRSAVVAQLEGPSDALSTLEGAALEMGLRWIRAGALVRHVPSLAPADARPDPAPSAADELAIVALQEGRSWAGWALQRAVATREIGPITAARLCPSLRQARSGAPHTYRAPARPTGASSRPVSVVVPTIDRYPYLEVLLHQLAAQTIAPHEVLIADQTPLPRRRDDLAKIEPSLPVTVIGLAEPGQSTARNAALRCATGELVLFLDDDDEIGPDLIADHLRLLTDDIDAICGAVDDATGGPPPPGYRHRRASTTFPTNHTMLRRDALARSGLFDLVFDHGPRADHDIGMRLHLGGAMLVYDPAVMVYHHHAPAGGLRTHNARTVTRAGARRSLTQRNLPSVTELYLGFRYFSERQRREARAVRLLSFVSGDGGRARRAARAVVQLLLLPSSARRLRVLAREAEQIFRQRPPIPLLDPDARPSTDG